MRKTEIVIDPLLVVVAVVPDQEVILLGPLILPWWIGEDCAQE